jgi:hypothetical protein
MNRSRKGAGIASIAFREAMSARRRNVDAFSIAWSDRSTFFDANLH